MTEITGGELFARALQAEGIEFLFGLPSPEVDALLVQLEAHGIRLVPVRHEAAGVHMAEGLYKTTGRGRRGARQPGPGVGEPSAGRSHRAARGRAGARHHFTAPAGHRLPLAALDVPGPGPARPLPPGGEVGRPGLRVEPHPRGAAPGLPRDVERAARGRCRSSCPRRSSTPPGTTRPHRSSRRPPPAARVRRPVRHSWPKRPSC